MIFFCSAYATEKEPYQGARRMNKKHGQHFEMSHKTRSYFHVAIDVVRSCFSSAKKRMSHDPLREFARRLCKTGRLCGNVSQLMTSSVSHSETLVVQVSK